MSVPVVAGGVVTGGVAGVAVPVAVLVALVSVVVAGVVGAAPVSVPVVLVEVAVDVVVPVSGVVGPQAVRAAANTTLVAARAIVWNLRAIKLVRLLLTGYAYLGHKSCLASITCLLTS